MSESELKRSKEDTINLVQTIFDAECVTEKELERLIRAPKRAQRLGRYGKPYAPHRIKKTPDKPVVQPPSNITIPQRTDFSPIEKSDIVTIIFDKPQHRNLGLTLAENLEKGGRSEAYKNKEERMEMLKINQIVGVFCEMAMSQYLYGNPFKICQIGRKQLSLGEGDGGHDLEWKGLVIDVKGSALSSDPTEVPRGRISTMRFICALKEWEDHLDVNVYVCAFMRINPDRLTIPDGPITCFLVGWLTRNETGNLQPQNDLNNKPLGCNTTKVRKLKELFV